MNASTIKAEDIIRCNVRGQRFFAFVEKPVAPDPVLKKRVITVKPLSGAPVPTKLITPRQVVGHWRKSARTEV